MISWTSRIDSGFAENKEKLSRLPPASRVLRLIIYCLKTAQWAEGFIPYVHENASLHRAVELWTILVHLLQLNSLWRNHFPASQTSYTPARLDYRLKISVTLSAAYFSCNCGRCVIVIDVKQSENCIILQQWLEYPMTVSFSRFFLTKQRFACNLEVKLVVFYIT